MPTWVLGLSYWFHLLATIAWLGSLAGMVLIVQGVLRSLTQADALSDLLYRRFVPLANLCLAVLAVTGMVQLVGERPPNYQGTLNFTSLWAQIILAKHIVIALMVAVLAYAQGVVDPALRRQDMLVKAGRADAAEVARLRGQRAFTLGVNFTLGIVVLALTAFATAL